MPIQEQSIQATPAIPNRQSNLSGTNENVNQRSSNKYAPWTIRLSQSAAQTFAGGTNQYGFDTQTFTPTYQALGTNVYSLKFAALGGYHYSTITLPQYGVYDFRFVSTYDVSAAVPVEIDIHLYLNGSNTKTTYNQATAVGNEIYTCTFVDTDIYNPGDVVEFKISNVGGSGNIATLEGIVGNYLIIRFMGVT